MNRSKVVYLSQLIYMRIFISCLMYKNLLSSQKEMAFRLTLNFCSDFMYDVNISFRLGLNRFIVRSFLFINLLKGIYYQEYPLVYHISQ